MATLVQLLSRCGIEVSPEHGEELAPDQLRRVFAQAEAAADTDPDGSRRIRLTDEQDQLTLTPEGELIVVHGGLDRDRFDLPTNCVRARTTAKAANELTKLRLWRAVEAGLRRAGSVGRPGRPATLEEWLSRNREDADRLQQQLDTLGLAAEKTHAWSAQVFEPALLAGFSSRETPFARAMAAYSVAEAIRNRILADTARRLSEKKRADPVERQQYLAQKEKLNARAARLYAAAGELFGETLAHALAKLCGERASAFSRSSGSGSASRKPRQAEMQPFLRSVAAQRDYAEARRILEPSDSTLSNTVQTINACHDPKLRATLATHFANHLLDVVKRLKTPDEVLLLLTRIDSIKASVPARAFFNGPRLDQCRRLILDQRPDVLPLL